MIKTVMRRGENDQGVLALVAADALAEEDMDKLPWGRDLNVTITTQRSLPQHRLYWAMLSIVARNMDVPVPTDVLHSWVKKELRVVDFITGNDGVTEEVPGSTSFEAMDQLQFNEHFNRAADLLISGIVYMERADLLRETYKLLKIPAPEDYGLGS